MASALLSLRQRNTYHGHPAQSYPKPMENGALTGTPDLYNLFGYINQESGSQVMEVIETSRSRAKLMVDVAIQVSYPHILVFLLGSCCSIKFRSPLKNVVLTVQYSAIHMLRMIPRNILCNCCLNIALHNLIYQMGFGELCNGFNILFLCYNSPLLSSLCCVVG